MNIHHNCINLKLLAFKSAIISYNYAQTWQANCNKITSVEKICVHNGKYALITKSVSTVHHRKKIQRFLNFLHL